MFRFPLFRKVGSSLLLGALLGVAGMSSAAAQVATGFTLQKRSGVALVKPQAWSKDNEATVMEFTALMDRTVKGSPGAGYFEFHSKSGDKRQVAAAKVIRVVLYPDPDYTPDITNADERAILQSSLSEYEDIVKKHPAARAYLSPYIKKLTEDLATFDSGKVRIDGKWVDNTRYQLEKAAGLVALLKADMVRAVPPGSFSFKEDPRFNALRKMAAEDPEVRKKVGEILDLQSKLQRDQQRDALMARLSDPELPTEEAAKLVLQLKTLKPEENSKVTAYIKSWDTGYALVEKIRPVGTSLAQEMETELATVTEVNDGPPALSPALAEKIAALDKEVLTLTAANPAPQLLGEALQARAVCRTAQQFKKLEIDFKERQYLSAKDTLDALIPLAVAVGPETDRVVRELHRFSLAQIDRFTRLRQEAKLLADNGKNAEALEKFEAAYEVMPDSTVAEAIEALKKQVK